MAKWFSDSTNENDVVISTRIRLARNLKGIPFPQKMTPDQAQETIAKVEAALDEMNYTFTKLDMSKMSSADKQKLVEERFISPQLAKSTLPCTAYISEDENISIMVNEEDHIRIQCIYAGFENSKAYELISKVDDYLSERLDYAMHEKYGYLTSCLTNVGTGMRISYMLHLPATVMTGASDSIFSTIGKMGVTVRGMYGEGTKSYGHIFQISNQTTLGRSEQEISDSLNDTLEKVIAKERELRTRLWEGSAMVIEDRIFRSYAILKSARILQSKEMHERLSDVRLGISHGVIEDKSHSDINSAMIIGSPAHIAADFGINDPGQRDVKRAEIIREAMK